jgi:amino acid transporter
MAPPESSPAGSAADARGDSGGPTLQRSLGLLLLVFYGLGTTIGAGIYVLIGEVAGIAGASAPFAFLGASLLAAATAGSFAELSARYPESAGEARYVREGFRSTRLGTAVGLLVVAAGAVSAAAIANGFAGYTSEIWGVPRVLGMLALIAVLTAIAAWGVVHSVRATALMTLVEIVGLLLVLGATREVWSDLPGRFAELLPGPQLPAWGGIGLASILAFYAYLGFEDMVNVAEEVVDVGRNLPLAIALVLVTTTLLYVLVATAAVLALPADELARSGAPLAALYAAGGGDPRLLGAIAVVAVVNGALVQIIMASRVLYGLARHGALPAGLARVHPRTRTPVIATFGVGAVIAGLAVAFPIVRLAEGTALLSMIVFALVNLALARLHRRGPAPPGVPRVPRWVPLLGAGVCLVVLAGRLLLALF